MTIVLLIACALIAAAGVPLILKLVPPDLGPVALFALSLPIVAIPCTAAEKKEWMEAYVADDVARAMLAADPALAADFRRKVAENAEFAKSPAARLEFFHRRHSSWDERLNLYPVVRTASPPK